MGGAIYTPVGPKSIHDEQKDSRTGEIKEIDYKDPIHMYKAKEELYNLFLDGKIAHISKVEELEASVKKLETENEKLKAQIQKIFAKEEEARQKQEIDRRIGTILSSRNQIEKRGTGTSREISRKI